MKKPQETELRMMHAMLCQAIAEPTRIALLYELGDGEKSVSQLVEALGVPQATVSRHLKLLRERNLVNTRRAGSYIFYSLSDARVLEAMETMRTVLNKILAEHKSLAKSLENSMKTMIR